MRISDWSSDVCSSDLLLKNVGNNSADKTPWLGDLPIIGTLFRSSRFRRQETELVIVVTPYLVKPVSASAIRLPTDGAKAPTDVERILLGKTFSGDCGATPHRPQTSQRSEESRVGNEWASTCRYRWSQYNLQNTTKKN